MPKVTGEFEITLRTPIYVSFDFNVNEIADLLLEVDGNSISIRPLKLKPHFADEEGDLIEPPSLERIRLWITKEIPEIERIVPFQLPSKERKRFEPIIIEAAKRFVSVIATRTGNWELDYRQPVDCYTSKYFLQDEKIPAEFIQESTRLIPEESAEGLILWRTDEAIGDLTEDIWNEVSVNVQVT